MEDQELIHFSGAGLLELELSTLGKFLLSLRFPEVDLPPEEGGDTRDSLQIGRGSESNKDSA